MIGITGCIGSGKSVVSRILRTQCFKVYDCDWEARAIMESSLELKAEISSLLGSDCVRDDFTLNRSRIADIVFQDADKLAWLNSRVHSLVKNDVIAKQVQYDGYGPFFVESAILKSSGLADLCKEIWVVTANEYTCVTRASVRDSVPYEKVQMRLGIQQNECIGFKDDITVRIIHNDGKTQLLPQIKQLLSLTENK